MFSSHRRRLILNEDLLHGVIEFASQKTLVALCTVSAAVNSSASRALYRTVTMRTGLSTYRFHRTVTSKGANTHNYAEFVLHFTEQLDITWAQKNHSSLHIQLTEIISVIPYLKSFASSLLDPIFFSVNRLYTFYTTLVKQTTLRSLHVGTISHACVKHLLALDVPALAHLEADVYERNWSNSWGRQSIETMAQFAASQLRSLRSLVLPGVVLQRLITEQQTEGRVWPEMRLVATPLAAVSRETVGLEMTAKIPEVFPGLHSLAVHTEGRAIYNGSHIDSVLPNLRHLTIVHNAVDASILADNHSICSLELVSAPRVAVRLDRLFGSPHVRALKLGFRFGGGVHALLQLVCTLFPGLVCLDVWVTVTDEEEVRTGYAADIACRNDVLIHSLALAHEHTSDDPSRLLATISQVTYGSMDYQT